MNKKGRNPQMFIPTLAMGILAAILVIIGYYRGEHVSGLKESLNMMIQMVPLLIFALIVAGMTRALLPESVISRWIGDEAGIKGVLIGTLTGAFTPGGPYVSMPIVAGLVKSGASVGIMVAYLTSWSLINVTRLPLDIGILGLRFTIVRFISVLIFPPIAGMLAIFINKFIK
ncbi:MAG: permease [Candidatus Omnitrophota bacterium]